MGTFLVALQFGLLFALAALAIPNVLGGDFPKGAFMLAGASIALAAWTLFHNKPGNFNIRPLPKIHGVLVTTGPYQWIRHPMYTSVLLGASALAVVLFLKSTFEERWMREKHPAYAVYRLRSKRFLPWLY